MGGLLNLAVRDHDGTVVTRTVDARQAAHLCQSRAFLEGAPTLLGVRLNHDPLADLAPQGCGLMVIDRVQRWLGHGQFFCDPSWWSNGGLDDAAPDDAETPRCRMVEAWKEGCIHRLRRFAPPHCEGAPWVPTSVLLKDLGIHTQGELLSHLDAHRLRWDRGERHSDMTAGVQFDPPGWQIERFDGSPEGWAMMANALLDRGFCFSGSGAAQWVEHSRTPESKGIDPLQLKAARAAVALSQSLPRAEPPCPAAPRSRVHKRL